LPIKLFSSPCPLLSPKSRKRRGEYLAFLDYFSSLHLVKFSNEEEAPITAKKILVERPEAIDGIVDGF
jgi:hypothetical protein